MKPFDSAQGKPIVSPHTRIRHPEHFEIGPYSIVDDFCYVSARVRIGMCSHIASGCSIAGGPRYQFTLGDFSSLSSGVKIWCVSNDFTNDLVCIVPADAGEIGAHPIEGNVTIGDYSGVGANSVVMPRNHVPEGTVIGALSFVPAGFAFEAWSVYAGVPIRRIGPRNRAAVVAQAELLRERLAAAAVRAKHE
jgi:acetyltransferase-like isoleucine patch superfamily enzyme